MEQIILHPHPVKWTSVIGNRLSYRFGNPNEAPWWSNSPRSSVSDGWWTDASDTDSLGGSDEETDILDPEGEVPRLHNPNPDPEEIPNAANPNEGTIMPMLPAMPSFPSSTLPLPLSPGALPSVLSPMGAGWMMTPGGLSVGGLPIGGVGSLFAPTTLLGGVGAVGGLAGGIGGAGVGGVGVGIATGMVGGITDSVGAISIGGLGDLFGSLIGQAAINIMPKLPDIGIPGIPLVLFSSEQIRQWAQREHQTLHGYFFRPEPKKPQFQPQHQLQEIKHRHRRVPKTTCQLCHDLRVVQRRRLHHRRRRLSQRHSRRLFRHRNW